MSENLTAHVVVPVATETDARETAHAFEDYEFDTVTAVHVIEKGEGNLDKIPLEQAQQEANEAFAAFQEGIPSAATELTYGSDVVSAVLEVAADLEASAIAFRPRGGSRVVQFLSGDTALRLVTEADRPVIALPEETDNDE